ncbi:MAG: LAGLIDADG family homing endonuclease [Candidatus Aenigmatarchaeota archaeon]
MELNIWDLPINKFYVKLNKDFVEEALSKIKSKYGSYKKFYNKYNIVESTFFGWRRNCLYPLPIVIKLCKLLGIPLDYMQKSVTELKSKPYPSKGGDISSPIFPNFPLKLSLELVRLIAHMLGDGCITLNKKGHYNFQYYNKSEHLREMFKADSRKVFGNLYIHEAVNKGTPYIFLPAPVAIIFLHLVKDFHSKKSRVPKFIKTSSSKVKREFIKSIFDDEGSVKFRKNERNIEFALSNKPFVNDVKILLNEFGIKTSKISERTDKKGYYKAYFYIRNYHNISKFYKSIGFYHPKKQKKLEEIIKFPGRKSYARGETKKLIINLLEERPFSTFELSKKLERSIVNVDIFARRLKNDGKIERFKTGKQLLWRVK